MFVADEAVGCCGGYEVLSYVARSSRLRLCGAARLGLAGSGRQHCRSRRSLCSGSCAKLPRCGQSIEEISCLAHCKLTHNILPRLVIRLATTSVNVLQIWSACICVEVAASRSTSCRRPIVEARTFLLVSEMQTDILADFVSQRG